MLLAQIYFGKKFHSKMLDPYANHILISLFNNNDNNDNNDIIIIIVIIIII